MSVVSPREENRGCSSLYLMFDVETVFLFPWAVILKDLGVAGLFNILFFMVVLILGLVYAWKKGALEWK